MGWAVLYIAFGIVALWLLGEVLLQYKARLRWRLLAFCGFLGVVVGVVVPSVVVIGIGAIAFAIGQTYVTMSFRQGFSTGWAIGGRPGASKRRRNHEQTHQEPTLRVSGMEETATFDRVPGFPDAPGPASAEDFANAATTIGPVFDADGPASDRGGPAVDGYEGYDGYADRHPEHAPGFGPDPAHLGYAAHPAAEDPYRGAYDPGTQQYAAYADPYPAPGGFDAPHDPYAPTYGQDPYVGEGYQDTPPGGVWVPQQRITAADGLPPVPEAPYDGYQGAYDPEHDERQPYRY
ncbi:hypothetical protein ACSMX9_05405 [Streptomyces sp. LE64]|uniref:hypothetical protein n=1 Tax=Streptomyces sp. LE64 TaxID=3448653 RepID=UPI004040FB59